MLRELLVAENMEMLRGGTSLGGWGWEQRSSVPLQGWALNLWDLTLSPWKQCQNWVKMKDTQLTLENWSVWDKDHISDVRSEVFHELLQFSHSVMSDSLQPQGLLPSRLLCPWYLFLRQEWWMGCHFLLQGIFPCLLHRQADSLPLSHQESLFSE